MAAAPRTRADAKPVAGCKVQHNWTAAGCDCVDIESAEVVVDYVWETQLEMFAAAAAVAAAACFDAQAEMR